MKQIYQALLLAAAMLAIAALAIFDIIPQEYAQWAPIALLVLFPSAWMGRGQRCGKRA